MGHAACRRYYLWPDPDPDMGSVPASDAGSQSGQIPCEVSGESGHGCADWDPASKPNVRGPGVSCMIQLTQRVSPRQTRSIEVDIGHLGISTYTSEISRVFSPPVGQPLLRPRLRRKIEIATSFYCTGFYFRKMRLELVEWDL